MHTLMKVCEYDEQEKCPDYEEKCSVPGRVDLTCTYWRHDYLGKNGGDVCTVPPKKYETDYSNQKWRDGRWQVVNGKEKT